jgi:hypothetical protein
MTSSFFRSKSFIILLIIVLSVAAFFPVFSNGFINYDDPDYVTNNPDVQSGISLQTFKWAFTSTAKSNWHPLTWISHALDYSLFGPNPGYHHAMNLLIHILSSILLFIFFEKMTKKKWQSALTCPPKTDPK